MSNIYFTSDTHFGHKNIASERDSQWKSGWRMYSSVDEMNQELVKSINSLVKEDDILYHLGDWSFGGIENIWNFRKQLRCQNIHLILGNHDHHIENNKLLENCHYFGSGKLDITDGAWSTLSSRVCARELFSSVSHYKEIRTDHGIFVLSHYPFAVWHGNGKGWYHLHGHCHESFNSIGKSMDVGVDVAISRFGYPIPFSIEEVTKHLSTKPQILLDHHDPSTNTGKIPK